MSRHQTLYVAILAGALFIPSFAQQRASPVAQAGTVNGTVTDLNDGIIPGANVILESPVAREKRSVLTDDNG